MTDAQIGQLMLLILGGLGALLILAAILIVHFRKKKNALCTEKTKGTYIKYRYQGNGIVRPIVEYTVEGKSYKVVKDYRGIKNKSVTGLPNGIQTSAWEDEKGWLNISHGSVVSYSSVGKELWPIGSETTVYYDPEKPKRSYVERPITTDFFTTMAVIFGTVIVACGVLAFILTNFAA